MLEVLFTTCADVPDEVLDADDQCKQADECALHALQMKGVQLQNYSAKQETKTERPGDLYRRVCGDHQHHHHHTHHGHWNSAEDADWNIRLGSSSNHNNFRHGSHSGRRLTRHRDQNEHPPCLCVFDIDRTLTAKQGTSCPGSQVLPAIPDDAYDGGALTLSELSSSGIQRSDCKHCYLGLCSAGDAHGANSAERKAILLKVLRNPLQDKLRFTMLAAAWSDEHSSPYMVQQENGKKHLAVEDILGWYARHGICIPREDTYFFDDRADNIQSFRGTGFNAKQISCQSRDGLLGRGEVGRCGATIAEVVRQQGVSLCTTDCRWNDWTAWSVCSHSCGAGGLRSRRRSVFLAAAGGGSSCEGESEDREECSSDPCPSIENVSTSPDPER
eukprot:TRINITY_DN10577_c0_g2_i1.p1 TRINITY_DN10577_c0_g2~~TRINITY_DN10577_c0_g2_i1.p1  ORF type:complete len:421 (-),score=56.16 TRINITY_DN10577_c0_g2_i1:146-1306(-)